MLVLSISWLILYCTVVSIIFHTKAVIANDNNSNGDSQQQQQQQQQYVMVGVSGGLQEGFPEHVRLDYRSGEVDGEVQAVFLGRALVRGYRSYLDVMEKDHRQYTAEPDQPLINCNVIPTGCHYHANEYWMYLVDTRQFLTILLHEPRFLSIAPDLGLVDLTAEETGTVIKYIATYERIRLGKSNAEYAAFPIVTGAWYNPTSHVLSPVVYTKPDGTEVTNFPQSLAVWSNVVTTDGECPAHSLAQNETFDFLTGPKASQHFFDSIRTAIRTAEQNRDTNIDIEEEEEEGRRLLLTPSPHSPSSFSSKCTKRARFGVSADMVRINYPFTPEEFQSILSSGGFDIDYQTSSVSTNTNKPLP